MLNWFRKNKCTSDELPNCVNTATTPLVNPPKVPGALVSVGLTDDNRISLCLGDARSSPSIYMNSNGAKSIITLLESAIVALGNTSVEELDEPIRDDNEDGC